MEHDGKSAARRPFAHDAPWLRDGPQKRYRKSEIRGFAAFAVDVVGVVGVAYAAEIGGDVAAAAVAIAQWVGPSAHLKDSSGSDELHKHLV